MDLPVGLLLIFLLRLLIPLTIFKWPLAGGLASAAVDALDTNLVKLFGVEIPNYVSTDKVLDMYYLSIELIVSLRWTNSWAKKTSIFLYVWRLVGVVAFELTQIRPLLFIFPNLFEHFFIYFVIVKKLKKDTWLITGKRLAVVLFILWLTKVPQELILHVYQFGTPVETFVGWVKGLVN